MNDIVQTLLQQRGIASAAERNVFLHPDFARDTHDPFLMCDMRKAVTRILRAIEKKETIGIYTDFDCDGIPGAALVYSFFQRIQYSHVHVYIPDRDIEGYGFHTGAIQSLKEKNVSLIITVDVGTVASEGILYAQSVGIDVIVTDHHEIVGECAPVYALLNPKYTDGKIIYPYQHLCGTGVAFKLIQALLQTGRESGIPAFAQIAVGWEKWLLDLVVIATVADMVPLTGENRVLAYWGLQVLCKTQRLGIRALCTLLKTRLEDLTEDDIGFMIAPRVNAASRMGTPQLAFELLTTQDAKIAERLASALDALNTTRKTVVATTVREANKRIKKRYTEVDTIVVLGDSAWKPSLAGLVAQSIVTNRGGLVCIWGRDSSGKYKGSFRSDGSISVPELCTRARVLFESYGGHERSGGFCITADAIHTFTETLSAYAQECVVSTVEKQKSRFDYSIGLDEVSAQLFTSVRTLAPFGMDNPKPVVHIPRVRIQSSKVFGKEKNHIEIVFQCIRTGNTLRTFDFFRSASQFQVPIVAGNIVDIVGTLERDTYRTCITIRLKDVI